VAASLRLLSYRPFRPCRRLPRSGLRPGYPHPTSPHLAVPQRRRGWSERARDRRRAPRAARPDAPRPAGPRTGGAWRRLPAHRALGSRGRAHGARRRVRSGRGAPSPPCRRGARSRCDRAGADGAVRGNHKQWAHC